VGEFVASLLRDIRVTVPLAIGEGDLVADRGEATGIRRDNGRRFDWMENHICRVVDGRINEPWPAGGLP
jgi:predicted ester cyclase